MFIVYVIYSQRLVRNKRKFQWISYSFVCMLHLNIYIFSQHKGYVTCNSFHFSTKITWKPIARNSVHTEYTIYTYILCDLNVYMQIRCTFLWYMYTDTCILTIYTFIQYYLLFVYLFVWYRSRYIYCFM